MDRIGERGPRRRGGGGHPTGAWLAALGLPVLVLAGCSLHVSGNGVSGSAFGHNFSAARGALPAGFPSGVPTPDHSRVLGGVGSTGRWDVGFAVTGDQATGTTAYEEKFKGAGYSVTQIESGSTPATGSTASPTGSTSTTVTLTGSVFRAADAQWTVEVESGSTSSSTGGTLKAGEFAVNITVVPTSSTTTAP